MAKGKDPKFRRKFYSLYLDTISVLVFSLMLVLVVWLSLRPTPVLEARQMAKNVAKLSDEERLEQSNKFIVHYISASKLTAANNPEEIALGSNEENGVRSAERYYSEYYLGDSLEPPRQALKSPTSSANIVTINANDDLLTKEEPMPLLGQVLNSSAKSVSTNSVTLITKSLPYVYWSLPDTIQASSMPNIEPIMRKYGWLSGSLDIIITIGDEGFVSNVVVCSEDVVDVKLLRELKNKLLALHLGKQNANEAMNIGVTWNLP